MSLYLKLVISCATLPNTQSMSLIRMCLYLPWVCLQVEVEEEEAEPERQLEEPLMAS
jgi:hypothetical protein